MNDHPQRDDPPKPLPLQIELPPVTPAVVGIAARRAAPVRAPSKPLPWGTLAAAALLLAAAGAGALYLAMPAYVRKQCVEQAAAHGMTLTFDDVHVELSGFRLSNVAVVAQDLPDARLTAVEVDVETSWLQPTKVSAKGMELGVRGRWDALDAALDKWAASDHGFRGSTWAALAPIVTDGSRIVWKDPIGEGARVEASGVHADVSWQSGATVLHASSDNVVVVTAAGTFGPWRIDVDRTPGASRTCLALDPGVPGACSVLVVGDQETTTGVDVVVPRSPLGHLGIPLQALGLAGKNLQVDAHVHYATQGVGRVDASSKGGLHGIEAPGLPVPIDVTWEGALSGDPRAGVDVKQARLAVGPLVGAVKGTFRRFTNGFRLDLGWAAGPVPCTALDTPLPPGQPFDVAYQLRKLAESAGLTKLAGEVKATASLTLDSRDIGSTSAKFVPEANCTLFAR